MLVFRQIEASQHRAAAGDVRRQEQSLPGHGTVSYITTATVLHSVYLIATASKIGLTKDRIILEFSGKSHLKPVRWSTFFK